MNEILSNILIHHHQKNSCQENNLRQVFVFLRFLQKKYFLARCETALKLLFVAKFACFNFLLNTEPVILYSIYIVYIHIVIYILQSGILFSAFARFLL